MFFWQHLTTIVILFPLIGAGTLPLVRGRAATRWTAFGFLCAALVLSLTLGLPGASGAEGLSVCLAVLTTYLCLATGLASWSASYSPRTHFVLLLILESGFLGTFLATNFIHFFIFFELCVVPLGWMIENWHGSRRPYSASKAMVYKFTGSITLLVVGIGINRCAGTMDLTLLATVKSRAAMANYAEPFFLLTMLAFLIRLGALPFHNWLADLQSQSPAPVAMILGGLMPLTGGYGILRIAIPLFPSAAMGHGTLLAMLGLGGIVYGALCGLAQTDYRKRIAYGTISNLGFAVLGIGVLNAASLGGAIYVLISVALTGALLIFASGVDQDDFGGLAVFGSVGIAGLSGFVGQFMVLLGVFQSSLTGRQAAIWSIIGCLGGLMNAASLLKMLRSAVSEDVVEVESKQRVVLILLAGLIVMLGIAPGAIVTITGPAVGTIIRAMNH